MCVCFYLCGALKSESVWFLGARIFYVWAFCAHCEQITAALHYEIAKCSHFPCSMQFGGGSAINKIPPLVVCEFMPARSDRALNVHPIKMSSDLMS